MSGPHRLSNRAAVGMPEGRQRIITSQLHCHSKRQYMMAITMVWQESSWAFPESCPVDDSGSECSSNGSLSQSMHLDKLCYCLSSRITSSADYYGRPSAIFRIKMSHVRSFLVLVWQNVRMIPAWSDQANAHEHAWRELWIILTCACARVLQCDHTHFTSWSKKQHETWLWGNGERQLGSKQETKASPSNPDYIPKMAGSARTRAPDDDVATVWYGPE